MRRVIAGATLYMRRVIAGATPYMRRVIAGATLYMRRVIAGATPYMRRVIAGATPYMRRVIAGATPYMRRVIAGATSNIFKKKLRVVSTDSLRRVTSRGKDSFLAPFALYQNQHHTFNITLYKSINFFYPYSW
ncbi:hypothetical protein [Evansella tamaricis]|uniref:hypothetical protein n=1 Tax=Evansella tamaricis TaxID=2069301 RepID=UPI00363909A0